MPQPFLSNITSTFFINLINRLGVRPPPPAAFLMSNVVTPVSIVDSDISIPATLTTQRLDSASSAGIQAAPAGGVVLADTGAQPAGNYLVFAMIGTANVGGISDYIVGRRNAANAAYLWRQVFSMNTATGIQQIPMFLTLLLNERIRVETNLATTASVEANLFIQAL